MKTTVTTQAVAVLFGSRDTEALAAIVGDLGFTPVKGSEEAVAPAIHIGLCLIDLRSTQAPLRLIRLVRGAHPDAVILVIADPGRGGSGTEAVRAGAFDVLQPPVSRRELEALLANASEQRGAAASDSRTQAQRPAPAGAADYGLACASAAMQEVLALISQAAAGRAHVLVSGERGSGRESIARAVHEASGRPGPFVAIDCAGPSPDDLEQDLFGNINRRAANAPERRGVERIERRCHLVDAAGGTLFLEQLAEMPARLQSRLVRVLRDREVQVGRERQALAMNVRVIATAAPSIDTAVAEGKVRRDLFDRLGSLRLEVPALRQRREDIPILAAAFVRSAGQARKATPKTLTRSALTLLAALPWRGNLPELRALMERLVGAVPGGLIRLEDVLAHTQLDAGVSPTGCDATLRQARARFEREYIAAMLQHHHGRMAEAARALGIQRTNLYRKMRRLNVLRGKSAGRGL